MNELPTGFELKPDADVMSLYYYTYLVARYNSFSYAMEEVVKDANKYLEEKGEE